MKLRIGYSPCPNDTFIFDAMVHEKIDTEGLIFEPILEDVETLNRLAFDGVLPITKLSYFAFAHLLGQYELLDAGSALGNNCGPLVIAKKNMNETEINQGKIAIPGKMTTANFLFSIAYPNAKNKVEMRFSDIENAVLNGEVAAGLIIHENRFTYQDKGLVKILDCGMFWENLTQLPIPLGGIVVKSNLENSLKEKINRVLKRSVEFAFSNPKSSADYVKQHAQEMDENVREKHINLYVNNYSISLGTSGKAAVNRLLDEAHIQKIIINKPKRVFV